MPCFVLLLLCDCVCDLFFFLQEMIGGAEARSEARALVEGGGDASSVIDLKNRRTLLIYIYIYVCVVNPIYYYWNAHSWSVPPSSFKFGFRM